MRTFGELMAAEEGRQLLVTRGVLSSEKDFAGALRPPGNGALAELVGAAPGTPLVYAAHQVMVDYPPSVIAKLGAIREIGEHSNVSVILLWLDMDRAGADKMSTGTVVRGVGGRLHIRLASRRHDDKEVRFVPLERAQLDQTLRKIDAWLRQHRAAAGRLDGLTGVLAGVEHETLARANLALTSFLLTEQLGMRAPSTLISDLAREGLLTEPLADVLGVLDDVVTVFNAAVDSLAAADVDPQVHHLRPDYLPLHYSCPRDDRRCTLSRKRKGVDTFAVTMCACGASYEFHLGSRSLSIEELAATGRWSADVTLPLYLNDLASGVVAGRSSAIYGMVLNEVVEKVLARRPIPMLLPPDLSAAVTDGAETKTLLQRYVEGQ